MLKIFEAREISHSALKIITKEIYFKGKEEKSISCMSRAVIFMKISAADMLRVAL